VETKEYTYTVLFEPAEEGGYVVTCPALPGLVTEGDTLEEARNMAKDAILAYLESLKKDDIVEAGQCLVIVEAMKMENQLLAEKKAKISTIKIKKNF